MPRIRIMMAESDQVIGEDEGREVNIVAGKPYLVTEPDGENEVTVIHQSFPRIPAEFFREV